MKMFSNGQVLVKTALIFLIIASSCGEKDNPAPQNTDPIVTDKGTPTGQLVSTSIGTSGGSLQSADGKIKVEIPAGALPSTTTVSIQPISNEAPQGLGLGYRLLPEGTTFSKPAKITFRYDDQVLGDAIEDFLWIVTQAADGSWGAKLSSEVNTTTKTVSVETTHFSDWIMGTFIELTLAPSSSALLVNKSLDLKINGFSRDKVWDEVDELGPDDLAPLVAIASGVDVLRPLVTIPRSVPDRFQDFRVKGWTLNGSAAPVNNINGSLSASGTAATFKAPAKKPASNPVAVSVELEGNNKEGRTIKYLLTSNIKIIESELYAILNVDGKTFEYTQYGLNNTVPTGDDYFVLNAGRSDHSVNIVGLRLNGNDMSNAFTLSIENPVKGSFALKCVYAQSYDDFTYSETPTPESVFQLTYASRERSGDACETDYRCGDFSVIITEYDSRAGGIIEGTFAGTVYQDKVAYENQCKTPDAHSVSGEFRAVVVN